ncbi:hypothetical protein RvY_07835 [Ramazzottius varieornatus]|uniref:Chitin-binding type-2 domain-containing protein n=1 Tax=Ramazzottius varieornatus TaxID=947166 RepID=A0A1D1V684_RAMVA|nr:hypothetical protein RvY_07835 [Ramazzottius varieornatus]
MRSHYRGGMDRLFIFPSIFLAVLLFQRTSAAPFKEPSNPSRTSVLCVLPQPSDDPPKSTMTTSRLTSQSAQAEPQAAHSHTMDENSSAEGNSSEAISSKDMAGNSASSAQKDSPQSPKVAVSKEQSNESSAEKSKSPTKAKNSPSKPSSSSAATKNQDAPKSSAADNQSVSAQLLDAKAPDAAKFVVTPQKRVSKAESSFKLSTFKSRASTSATSGSSAGRSNYEVPGAVLFHSGNGSQAELFGEKFDMSAWVERTERNDQGNVWTEMDNLRGREAMTPGEIQDTLQKAVPGKDYPNYSSIPATSFKCENVHQAGFYADPEARCQVIRRCDVNAMKWSYLCPNGTLFSQITLTCQWFFDVDCSKAVQYYDYSNSRLYHSDWVLLDTPPDNRT